MTTYEYLYEYLKGKDTLEYFNLRVNLLDGSSRKVDYDYEADIDDIIEELWDMCDAEDLPNGDDTDPEIGVEFIKDHYDEFREKYNDKLLKAFENRATEHIEENCSSEDFVESKEDYMFNHWRDYYED